MTRRDNHEGAPGRAVRRTQPSNAGPKTRARARRRATIVKLVTPTIRVDVLGAAKYAWDRAVDLTRRWRERRLQVEWSDAPVGALVLVLADGRIALRSTTSSGALVGRVDDADRPRCDDWYEHEPWTELGERFGQPPCRVLARGVCPDAGGAELERIARRGLIAVLRGEDLP